MKIQTVQAIEILDSRGNPTVQVTVALSGGARASAQVPSGASTGRHEALELRDGDPARYGGKGVRKAVANVNEVLGPGVAGLDARDQAALDARLIQLDGTPGKTRLGANAILGVSCAVARAAAIAAGEPLWRCLAAGRPASIPLPMINVLSGGHHAGHNFEFQDFLAVPHGFPSYGEALHAAARVRAAARDVLAARGQRLDSVADEGGWGPRLASNQEALDIMTAAIETAGYQPGRDVSIAIDVAATHFWRDGSYTLATEGRVLDAAGMVDLLAGWRTRYPIVSIEDGLGEEDWAGMRALTAILGANTQILGDDFFTTNPARLERGIQEEAANSVLVKMNQIGTLTETFHVIDRAREAGFTAVISARSGETEDTFLADLSVASGMGQIKVGSLARSERLAKYNRLLELEAEAELPYAGPAPLQRFLAST